MERATKVDNALQIWVPNNIISINTKFIMDKIISKRKLLGCLIIAAGMLENATAATLYSVNYSTETAVTKEADLAYLQTSGPGNGQWDGISTIFHAPVTTSNSEYTLTSSLYGRHYDSDPSQLGETGLLDRAAVAQSSELPAWLIKHGLPPSSVGSLQSNTKINNVAYITNASYLAFSIGIPKSQADAGDKVLFDGAQLSITGFNNIDSEPQIWAATNGDNFGHAIIPRITQPVDNDTDVYTFDFSDLSFSSSQLEIRVYGVIGQDQGTFTSALASGRITPPPNIPEPTSFLLVGLVFIGAYFPRRR